MAKDNDVKISIYSDEKPGTSPLGVVPRDPTAQEVDELFLDFAASEMGFLFGVLDQSRLNDLAASGEEWDWEDYQLDYLEHNGWYSCNKARQTGWSAVIGAVGSARGILTQGNYTGIFVSYKKEEAISKVRYVRAFLASLPPSFRKKVIRDPLHLIEWENHNGTISRIISHAQKPIRGHHGDVWLDEFAFFQQDRLIYESALPIVTQVNGQIAIGSTPFGKGGMFWDIMDDAQRYPEFKRRWIYWWECSRYLKDPSPEFKFKAMIEAPKMSVDERIEKFGNDKIKIQFRNLDLETFLQEFEGLFVDEQASFFPRNLILSCMFDQVTPIEQYDPRETDFEIPIEEALAEGQFKIQARWPDVSFKRYDRIEELAFDVQRGKVSSNLYAGVDVGATIHSTDIRILEEIVIGKETLQVERFALNVRGWPLPKQQAYLDDLVKMGLVRKMILDGNGIGMQMGQALKAKYPTIVYPVRMNGQSKIRNRFMNNLRNRMVGHGIALAYDRQMLEDLHCIRSVITQNKTQRFITEEKKLHHGDGAWALSFASLAGTPWGLPPSNSVSTGHNIQRPGWGSDGFTGNSEHWLSVDGKPDDIDQIRRHARSLQSNGGSLNTLKRLSSMFGGKGSLRRPEGPGRHISDWDR